MREEQGRNPGPSPSASAPCPSGTREMDLRSDPVHGSSSALGPGQGLAPSPGSTCTSWQGCIAAATGPDGVPEHLQPVPASVLLALALHPSSWGDREGGPVF